MKLHALILIGLAMAGCHRGGAAEDVREPGATTPAQHGDEKAEHEELPKQVRLTPQVIAQAKVTTSAVDAQVLPRTVELTGQVVPDPDYVAMLGARVGGRVQKVEVREGDAVKAGQALVIITSPELAKQRAQYVGAVAKAESARRNAQRLQELVKQRLGSSQEADAAAAEATEAEAERDGIAQTLKGMGTAPHVDGDPSLLTLASPISGQVVQRDAVLGQVVEPGHTLFTVADLAKVWFQVQLFEKDLGSIEESAKAEVRLNGYPDAVYTAKVLRIASQVDPQAHTLTARLAFDQPDARLRLGLFGTARVSKRDQDRQPQLVVPLAAVTELGEKKVVFVQQPDGDYEWHEVTLGDSASGSVEVLAGLNKGERVVVQGAHTLKSAVLKSTMKDED